MIDLGERTGRIEDMLRQIATYMEREDAVAKRVKSALAYPAFMMVLAFAVVGILMTTALPALVEMFKEFDGYLPITTRILIAMTDFTTGYRTQLLGAVVLVVLGAMWLFGQPAGKRLIDRALLTVPVFRAITINANAARFSRTLAILLRAGLPLTEIMDMVVATTDNTYLRRSVEGVRKQLMDGEGLSGPMARAACYPQMLVQMVAVGEETGTLDANLDITAEFYTREVDQKVDALTGMMTPISDARHRCRRRLHRAVADHADVPAHRQHQQRRRRGYAAEMKARLGSEQGVALVESLVALAILGTALVIFLGGMSTGLLSTAHSDRLSTAHELARSQMEYTKGDAFHAAPYAYSTVPAPADYALSASATGAAGGDANIELITVVVTKAGTPVFTLEGFKVNR